MRFCLSQKISARLTFPPIAEVAENEGKELLPCYLKTQFKELRNSSCSSSNCIISLYIHGSSHPYFVLDFFLLFCLAATKGARARWASLSLSLSEIVRFSLIATTEEGLLQQRKVDSLVAASSICWKGLTSCSCHCRASSRKPPTEASPRWTRFFADLGCFKISPKLPLKSLQT